MCIRDRLKQRYSDATAQHYQENFYDPLAAEISIKKMSVITNFVYFPAGVITHFNSIKDYSGTTVWYPNGRDVRIATVADPEKFKRELLFI